MHLQVINSKLTYKGRSYSECNEQEKEAFDKLLHFEKTGEYFLTDAVFREILKLVKLPHYLETYKKEHPFIEVICAKECDSLGLWVDVRMLNGHLFLKDYGLGDDYTNYKLTTAQLQILEKYLRELNNEAEEEKWIEETEEAENEAHWAEYAEQISCYWDYR